MTARTPQLPSGRRYLLSVIGFSSTARVVTSALTLVSFPIALRAVGASDYGAFVYITALLSVVVCLADFGIAAAAGKAIAEARLSGIVMARTEMLRRVRLQTVVATVALAPVIAASFFAVAITKSVPLQGRFLVVMALGAWVGVGTNFIRSCLRSFLAFGKLAVLDAVESIARTVSWLAAAWLLPSAMGLAVASLTTAVTATLVGAVVLVRAANGPGWYDAADLSEPGSGGTAAGRTAGEMLLESANFLGMSLSTRLFQSVPFIVFGQLLNAEIVGVIGAFNRLLEIVSFPFLTIGNALAVRAQEVKRRGLRASTALWDACWRFVVLAAIVAGGFLLTSGLIAHLLVPGSSSGHRVFAILSVSIGLYSVCSFLPVMSDFVGGLRSRIVFLATLAVCQIPLLWGAITLYGETGGVLAYLAVQLLMVCGYVIIAKRVFFGEARYTVPPYITASFGVVLVALAVSAELGGHVSSESSLSTPGSSSIVALLIYVALISLAFFAVRPLRQRFLTLAVFEFTRS